MSYCQLLHRLVISIALLVPFSTPAASIIFDLGDVLVETKYSNTLYSLSWPLACYASTWRNPFGCHKLLFDYLHMLDYPTTTAITSKDPHGHALPSIMCEWLKGTISHQEILALMHTKKGTFKDWAEERLIYSLAELIFIPEYFIKTRALIPEGVAFVQECKEAGHKLYILSNWDPASFELLYGQHQDFFDLFDGIMISGKVQLIKPDPAIYLQLLHHFKLVKEECIFIDDQLDNVHAAHSLGIFSIHHTQKRSFFSRYIDFDGVREKINTWHQLNEPAITMHQAGHQH